MSTPDDVRDQLLRALRGGGAHPEVTTVLEECPSPLEDVKLPNAFWNVLSLT